MKKFGYLVACIALSSCVNAVKFEQESSVGDLHFNYIAQSWDEGIPLGNAVVGALLWSHDSTLRMSLDRVDLWDLRPTDSLSGDNYRFSWVKNQIAKGDYLPVQKKFDESYDNEAAPSKIPGAALEFTSLGEVDSVHLFLQNALSEIVWKNGAKCYSFVQANHPVGWFVFENLPTDVEPIICPPRYKNAQINIADPVTGQDLSRLGYEQGEVISSPGLCVYHQNGYGDFSYDVAVRWKMDGSRCIGAWSVTSSLCNDNAVDEVDQAFNRGVMADYKDHLVFWHDFWHQSAVHVPDSVLQRQYENEIYKLGCVARENSYPISLQAIWTADNGKLPPWKGDYHHDLNTQLSYWPTYTGNHLKEELGYLNTLWSQRDVYKKFTKQYFEKDGLAIPGVCTLTGEPMGGWIQYAMSQTTAAWLAQHFYLHWKYSADRDFLKNRAYPFVRDAAVFLEQQTELNSKGVRTLTYSSSPEIFDNSIHAWFHTITNYDLSLTSFLFKIAAEMATNLGLDDEATHWSHLRAQLPPLSLDETGALTYANGFPYNESHRHFSHSMAIHPLGLINYEEGGTSRQIIEATVKKMKDCGSAWWTGYSFAWFAHMKARMFDGEGARDDLKTFAECFCLPNTFHANGDQSMSGKSNYHYRPVTLEGNFAFASGIHEMLLQSHTDTIRVFPAIPDDWKDVSFKNLRAQGAFLVNAKKSNGKMQRVEILSEQGSDLLMISPFDGSIIRRPTKKGECIVFTGE
jgi:hypothetical protein